MGIILGTIAAIAVAATTVVNALAVVGLAVEGLKTVGNVFVSLGKALGLIKSENKVDELGDKALQSEYNPEDFDSYAEYVRAVEEYDDLDSEKSKKFSEEDKIRKGMELAAGVIIEKYKDFPIEQFCVAIGDEDKLDYFNEARIEEIGKLIMKDGQYISDILGYINGSEKDDMKICDTIEILTDIEKTINPNVSDKEALKTVLEVRK